MRVAYVSTDPGVPVFGCKGASVHVQAVLRVLVDHGADVHVVTPRPGGEAPAGLAAVHVHELALDPAPGAGARERAAQRCEAAVGTVLQDLCDGDRIDLVYERYALWGRTAMRWAAEHSVASILEVNAPLVEEQARHRKLADMEGAQRVAREAISAAGAVCCVSDPVTRWARRHTPHPHRVHTVANGVDTRRFRPAGVPADSKADDRAPFTIGFVGTLKPWHGVHHLLDAVELLNRRDSSYRLLIVGDGPEASALTRRAHDRDLAGVVEMTGAVPAADIPAYLQRMQVGVAPYPPTPSFYFSPLKVYEYLAAGLPVVASRVGDLAETLADGCGVLVEPGRPAALAEAIAALRADPARRRAMGRAARKVAVARHDWTAVVGRILDLSGAAHVG